MKYYEDINQKEYLFLFLTIVTFLVGGYLIYTDLNYPGKINLNFQILMIIVLFFSFCMFMFIKESEKSYKKAMKKIRDDKKLSKVKLYEIKSKVIIFENFVRFFMDIKAASGQFSRKQEMNLEYKFSEIEFVRVQKNSIIFKFKDEGMYDQVLKNLDSNDLGEIISILKSNGVNIIKS